MQDNKDHFLRSLFTSGDPEFVEALYAIFLGRAADEHGRKSYSTKLRLGYGRIGVLREIAGSRESASKALPIPAVLRDLVKQGTHPYIVDELLSLGDRAFIELAYRTILGREPDNDGLNFFLPKIRKGVSRRVILGNLRFSAEGKHVNADIPGLDRVVGRYRVLNWPVVGRVLSAFGFGREPVNLNVSLNRIENYFCDFRDTPLGDRLAGQANATDLVTPYIGEKILAQLAAGDGESRKVTGNVALPGKVMADGFEVRRILLVKLDHIGDFFVSVRPMAMLRDAWPDAHITLICGPWNVSLAESLGIFDEIHSYSFFNAKTGEEQFDWEAEDWAARCDGVGALALGRRYDLAIDLRHDSDTRRGIL